MANGTVTSGGALHSRETPPTTPKASPTHCFARTRSWVAILAGALVVIVMVGPWLTTMDKGEISKTIGVKLADSKSSAASYISSWTATSEQTGGDDASMPIGDDADIDYDDYKDNEDGDQDREYGSDYAYEAPGSKEAQTKGQGPGASEKGQTKTPQTTKTAPDAATRKMGEGTFLKALEACNDMVCVREAHNLPRGETKFNFPHFLIIGFQKAATTSLHVHLGKHDAVLRPAHKEPEHFTKECKYNPPEDCSKEDAKKYVRETLKLDEFISSKGQLAAFESSTHVVRNPMAPALHKLIPWAKVVINVREPISRAASMLIHMLDVYNEGCLAENDLGYCLHARSQIRGLKDGTTTYYDALAHWFTHWPEDQIHIVQYEELIDVDTEDKVMREVKSYIGLDPELPKSGMFLPHRVAPEPPPHRECNAHSIPLDFSAGLTVINDRRFRISPEGWKMKRSQYEKLLKLVKPDVEALLDLLEAHGKLGDRKKFLKRWTDVWDANLKSCDSDNVCTIQLS